MANRLSADVTELILSFPEYKMGVHKVALVMKDGTILEDVYVAWGDEIVRMGKVDSPSIETANVVSAENRS